jgi:catechol 2,3-dioxygenase-like lactoylglutathione lyase family enzyme
VHGTDVRKELEEVERYTPQPKEIIKFYEKFFGSKPAWQSEDAAEFRLGGVKFFIHRITSSKGSPSEDHLAFCVEDVDKACVELRSKGLKIERMPRDYSWGRSAFLRDPDGRWLELHQKPMRAEKRKRARK